MAGIVIDSIADLFNGVIDDYMRDDVDQTQLLQDHPGIRQFLEGAKTTSGKGHETNLRIRDTTTFKWVGLFELTPNNRVDVMRKIVSVIKHTEEKVHYDEREEAIISQDAERIYDHIAEQANGAITKTYEGIELQIWGNLSSTLDTKKMLGVPSLLVPLAAGLEDTNGSFSGTTQRYDNGATTTTIQGLIRDDPLATRARSFTMTRQSSRFDEATNEQLGRMKVLTQFRSIPMVKNASGTMPSRRRAWYMGTTDFTGWQAFVSNTGTGKTAGGDVGWNPDVLLHGLPVEFCPAIDNLSDQPIFLIDDAHLYGRRLPGLYMKWTDAVNSRDGVQIYTKALVNSVLLHCKNPRHAGVRLHLKIAA